jgi:Ferritin-like domain
MGVSVNDHCGGSNPTRQQTRGQLFSRGLGLSALLTGGGLLAARPGNGRAGPSPSNDKKILNFALQLEYLQAAFYAAAINAGKVRGEALEFAETVAEHEQEHVELLLGALGSSAGRKPQFDFGHAVRAERAFVETAVLLENTGVAAYNGQAPNLTKKSLAAAAEIVSVEGRHAAWASAIAGREPAPRAADPGAAAAAIVATLDRTGFVR